MTIKTLAITTAMTCATAGAAIIPITPADYTNPKVLELLTPPNEPLVGGFDFQDDWCDCYALRDRPDLEKLITTDYFQHRPTDVVTLSWNLPDIYPVGGFGPFFRVNAVAVYNPVDFSIYEVTGPNKFSGQVTVAANNPIQQIYLFGSVFAPDNGSTIMLLVCALAALLGFRSTKQQTKGQ